MGDFFNALFIQPIVNVLVVFYNIFQFIGLPGAFGFSIIAVTVVIRMLMHPFFKQQLHTAKKMKSIKPHIDALNKKHKDNPQTLQQEQMKLYKEHGINPAGGCLFAIIQIPVIYGLYTTLQMFLSNGSNGKTVAEVNSFLYSSGMNLKNIDPNFFVYNIALTPAQGATWYYFLVPVVTGILQYFQTKYSMPQLDAEPAKADTTKENGEKEEKKLSTSDEFQKAMNMQMKYIFPVMIGYFSYTLPTGLSLYWNAFSLYSIIAHYFDERKIKNN